MRTGRKRLSAEEREERDREFQRLYVEENLPLEVIGGRLGWHPSTVGNVLRQRNVQLRPAGRNYYSTYTRQGKARLLQTQRTEAGGDATPRT